VLDRDALTIDRFAQQIPACSVDDAYAGRQMIPNCGKNRHTPGSGVKKSFERGSCHLLQLIQQTKH
jgi:hypothetical protein